MPSKFSELKTGVESGLGTYQVRFPNQIGTWYVVEYRGDYVTIECTRSGHRMDVSVDQICYVQNTFLYRGKSV